MSTISKTQHPPAHSTQKHMELIYFPTTYHPHKPIQLLSFKHDLKQEISEELYKSLNSNIRSSWMQTGIQLHTLNGSTFQQQILEKMSSTNSWSSILWNLIVFITAVWNHFSIQKNKQNIKVNQKIIKDIGWYRDGYDVCYYQNNLKRKNGDFFYTLTFSVKFPCTIWIT